MVMTLEERGAYIGLLCAAWQADEIGYLPDDDKVLSALCGAGVRWKVLHKNVKNAFDREIRPGWLVQKRMVEERIEQESRYLKAVEGGRKSWQGASLEKRRLRATQASLEDASRVP